MGSDLIPLKHLAGINEMVLSEDTDPERRVRYVDIGSVGRGELVAEPTEVRFGDAPSRARRLVQGGDTIVSTVRTYLRAVWPVPAESDDLVVSTGFAVLTPREVDPRYFSWWVRSDPFIEEVVARSVGVSYPAINALEVGELRVRVPDVVEQQAIADFLDTETARIDGLIAKKRGLTHLGRERWCAELVETLRVPSVPEPWRSTTWPSGWSVKPLRRLLAAAWGGDWGADPGSAAVDLPCVRAADFDFINLSATDGRDRSFAISGLSRRVLNQGDIVIEKSGGGEGVPVGRAVQWRGEGPAVPTNFAGGLRAAKGVDADFVLLVLRAAYEVGLPWRSIKQTTGLQNLDLGHYLSHGWGVPSMAEQKRIAAEVLASLEEERRLNGVLRQQIELLSEHRQALITAAVTGELDVPGVAA